MRRTTLFLLALAMALTIEAGDIISQREGSITFAVDGDLPVPSTRRTKWTGDLLLNSITNEQHVPNSAHSIVARSAFADDSLYYYGPDVMFQCMRYAYAHHHPLVLSPDVVWLLVAQGFARYANAHAEELRDRLVSHSGKQELVVTSDKDLLSEQVDWPRLMDGFTQSIGQHTKDGIARTMTADFTTTGTDERIASQVTLMDAVKSYFDYTVLYIVCGIPYITVQGTPQDWLRVLDKTQQLRGYGLDGWVAQLEPLLQQFVRTAKGQPDRRFWQSIVRHKRTNELRGGGCSPDRPDMLDGWFLAFFPDENGQTQQKVRHDTRDMPSGMVRVGFQYKQLSPSGDVVQQTPIELWAGFVGEQEDPVTRALTPRIGWLVRTANAEEEAVHRLYMQDRNTGIHLRVSEVPLALSQLERIRRLDIEFTDRVVLPLWLDDIPIEHLTVRGRLTDKEAEQLRRRFPKIKINDEIPLQ